MRDSRKITEHVWAHQYNTHSWLVRDHFRDETSIHAYATYEEARKAYFNGEVCWQDN